MNNQKKNPEQDHDPLIGTILADFRIDDLIGAGGMGRVYKATQLSLDKTVAVKVLSSDLVNEPGFVNRFVDEARLAAFLDHQNIVRIITAGEDKGRYYIAMEYVDGRDLRQYLKAKGAAPEAELAFIVRETAKALSLAHENNIIHRDIKTDNIMITRRGEVKLADFGIAKAVMEPNKTRPAHATQTGMTIGTPKYMSPEQERGESLDGRSDLYSLGVVIYEALVGDVPSFHSQVTTALPKKMQGMILKLLARTRGERYASAKELIKAVETAYPEILGAATIDEIGKVSAGKGAGASSGKRTLLLVSLLLVMGIAGIIGYRYFMTANLGTLAVESTPDKAAVFLDGAMIGQTPLKANVLRGQHEIRVSKEKYRPWLKTVKIEKRRTERLEVALEIVRGNIMVATEPPGAAVLINQEQAGETPLELRDIDLGDYRIELRKQGYLTHTLDAHLTGEQTVHVKHEFVQDPIVVYLEEGKEHFNKGNYPMCISNMKRVLDHDPTYEEAKEYLSRCENKQKMETSARINKYLRDGKDFYNKKQYDRCIDKMKEALAIDSRNRTAREYQGLCEQAKKDVLRKWREQLGEQKPTVREQ